MNNTELKEFEKILSKLKNENKKTIEKFMRLDGNYNLFNDIFIGWKKQINMSQYKTAQRLLMRQKYPTSKNKFIFDIEANKYGEKKIVQFAYYVVNENNKVIDCDMYYVFNEGVYSDYYGKIKYPTLKEFGVNPTYLYEKIKYVISQCETLIGHNILNFDCKIIKKYFERFGLNMDLTLMNCYDTMKESKSVVNLKNKRGGAKWATLTELSDFFGVNDENDSNYHDALYDVHMTYLCYVCLIKIS